MSERPLVSFVLIAYNHEKYIREAVDGALAQTYSPLEIVLSDDGSKDRTFEIMEEMAAAYQGPHKLVLNKNPKNLGIGGHVKKIGDLAAGKWIVMAAGDDVSLPQRTEALMRVAVMDSRCAAVFSDSSVIDDDGNTLFNKKHWNAAEEITLRNMIIGGGGVGAGATYAYLRELWAWPFPYPQELINEDRILPLRATLFGKVMFTDECLIKWRQSVTSVTHTTDLALLLAIGKEDHVRTLIEHIRFAAENDILSKWEAKDHVFCLKLLHSNMKLRRQHSSRLRRWMMTIFISVAIYRARAPKVLLHHVAEFLKSFARKRSEFRTPTLR